MSDYIVGYLDKLEKFSQSKVERISELERENAELRKAKDMVELERCEMMRSMSLMQNYFEQLRADKERLDWLAVTDVWFDEPATESYTPETFRAEIDRKRKDNP